MRRPLLIALVSTMVLAGQDAAPDRARLGPLLATASEALSAGRLDEADRTLVEASRLGKDVRIEILRAELLLARKDPAGAAALMADAIARNPEGEAGRAAHRTWARALIELGRLPEAAPAILRSLGLDDDATPSLALAARGFAERGDRRTARSLLGIAIQIAPARLDLLRTRAALAIEAGDPHEALSDAEAAAAAAPGDAEARVLRARALDALGRRMEARDALATLDRVSPLPPDLARALGRLNLDAGLLDEAGAAFRRRGPLSAEDALALARAWIDRGEPARALEVTGVLPGANLTPEVQRLRATAFLDLGEPDRAAAALGSIADPTPSDRIALARAEALGGRLDSAMEILNAVLEGDPGLADARADMVRLCVLRGFMPLARRHLAAGLALTPRHPALVQALDDLVPELAPVEPMTIDAVLKGRTLVVDGTPVEEDPAAALRQIRALRLSLTPSSPSVRLLVLGATEAAALARAVDLLAAAGFSRVWIDAARR